jgi:hypothetical protein
MISESLKTIYFTFLIQGTEYSESIKRLDLKARGAQDSHLVNANGRGLLLQTKNFYLCHRMAHKLVQDSFLKKCH